MGKPLANARHERFAQEYLVDLNGAQAAVRAGYSPKSAKVTAARLLTDANLAARIADLKAGRAERVEFTADEVVRELKVLGLSNVEHYTLDDDGHLALAEGAPPEAIRAVSSVKRRVRTVTTTRGGEERTERTVDVEFKLWDKPAALRMGGQHLGMFGPDGSEKNPIHHVARVVGWPAKGEGDAAP